MRCRHLKREASRIACGGVVWRLARSLGLLCAQDFEQLWPDAAPFPALQLGYDIHADRRLREVAQAKLLHIPASRYGPVPVKPMARDLKMLKSHKRSQDHRHDAKASAEVLESGIPSRVHRAGKYGPWVCVLRF